MPTETKQKKITGAHLLSVLSMRVGTCAEIVRHSSLNSIGCIVPSHSMLWGITNFKMS